jgi:hypothetical protein
MCSPTCKKKPGEERNRIMKIGFETPPAAEGRASEIGLTSRSESPHLTGIITSRASQLIYPM